MSRVYFHSPSEPTAELLGAERAHANVVTLNLALGALGLDSYRFRETIEPLLTAKTRTQLGITRPEFWDRSFRAWWWAGRGGDSGDDCLHIDGRRLSPFDLTLNTAVAIGSSPIELLARLHATCEIHGYVEGPNREWLASVIEDGRDRNILRAGMGWEAIVDLLMARDDEPVVMSYSVTEWFPDHWLPQRLGVWTPPADAHDDDDCDDIITAWGALPETERWALALKALRQFNETGHVELDPETWGEQGYGPHGWSVFDLQAAIDRERSRASTC